MNSVNLIGRLAKRPDLRKTKSDKSVLNITLAVQGNYKDPVTGEYKVDFIPCIVWGSAADVLYKHTDKGHRLGVTGRLQSSNYEKDGITIYKQEVVVEDFTFAQDKKES